jgi:phosphinothricin acetyltransferase
VDAAHRGQGIGRKLYEALLEQLRQQGFYVACAGITLPNDASVALHEGLGFVPVEVYERIGWKEGAWRDVGWCSSSCGARTGPRLSRSRLHDVERLDDVRPQLR